MGKQGLRIGSRGSALALAQNELLRDSLRGIQYSANIEIKAITTSGDRKRYLANVVRDKLDWIAEVQQSLLAGEIDIALHSGKDVPVAVADGTRLLPILPRAVAQDACVVHSSLAASVDSLAALPQGARVGTSSRRRRAQLLSQRPDLEVIPLRGNVPTRLAKLEEEHQFEAIVIAGAGLSRLALEARCQFLIPETLLLPAVNQGILIAQIRSADEELSEQLQRIAPESTVRCSEAERRVVAGLGADCHSALGVLAQMHESGHLKLAVQVFSSDGSKMLQASGDTSEYYLDSGASIDSERRLADALVKELLDKGAKSLLDS